MTRHIASEAREDASSDGISWITAGETVVRLVHDSAKGVGKRDQPRVRGRTLEESSK